MPKSLILIAFIVMVTFYSKVIKGFISSRFSILLWITFVVATDNTLINPFIFAAALQEHAVLVIQGRVEGPVSTFGDASADIC